MLLLHGFTGTWRIWQPLLEPLGEYHDVLALTLPGHHGGPTVETPVSIALLADGVERSLDEHGLGIVHVCGNSLGGWLALELARRGRASSVVALSPAGGWHEAKDMHRTASMIRNTARLSTRTAPLLRGPLISSSARRRMLRPAMERGDRMPAGQMLEMLEDISGCAIMDDLMLATQRDGPFTGDMSRVSCRVRIAWGQNDRAIPADQHGRPLLDRVPTAEFVVMPGVGHLPMYDDPLLVAATVLEVTLAVDAAGAELPVKAARRRRQ